MPRTQSAKKRGGRFCADCGYELTRDNDDPCPMCERLEQLRLDFIVPRPSDLATHRPGSGNSDVPSGPDEWPPTVAEYRAILAERRLRSSALGHGATVIRTPALKQRQVPPQPRNATTPGDTASAPAAEHKPPAKDRTSPPPTKAKTRHGQSKSRRAARARVRSSGAFQTTTPPAGSQFLKSGRFGGRGSEA